MTVAQALELRTTATPQRQRWRVALRRTVSFLLILLFACSAWEGYKAVGAATLGKIPLSAALTQALYDDPKGIPLPVRPDDKSMPHVWTIIGALVQPARRGNENQMLSMQGILRSLTIPLQLCGREISFGDIVTSLFKPSEGCPVEPLSLILIRAGIFTWREAAAGFVVGSLIGLALGAVFGRFLLLERSLMPYIVASQTVPLLAIAPMIVIWGGRLNWPAWWSVSVISAYLTFFPVTINTLRGLRSPNATAVELMRSYAASEMQVLWKLRLPAALPYIFTALKVSATASVIGAVVGELPSGIPDGLGRVLLTFSYYYISGPEKLYAAIVGAAALGILFAIIVAQMERLVVPEERRLAE